jgi:hypothetical protein
MTKMHQVTQPPDVLGPDDLRIAADAFEAVVSELDESTCEHAPYVARRLIARHIIERSLSGERDAGKLREGALRYVCAPKHAA